MWSSVLVLGLLAALNPVRLGLALLVISRPRPVQNLLAYWVGCLMVSVTVLLVPLAVLHFTPMFRSFAHDLATPDTGASSTVRHIQIGMGVLALSIAALLTVRFSARPRAVGRHRLASARSHRSARRQQLPTPGANTSTLVSDSNTPPAISRLLGRPPDAPTEGGSATRRLLGRAHNAWENGSLWVAVVIGAGSGPTADGALYVLAIIVPSGAAIGTQFSAAIAFVVVMLGVVEITLVSYLVTPAKTQAMVRLLHDWARAHRRKVLVAMFAVVGVALVANGMGGG